jgi:hypothetical protein
MPGGDRRHRDLEEAEDLSHVARATLWSSGTLLVGLPALLAVWVLIEPDAIVLVYITVAAMVPALIALGGGFAAAGLGQCAADTTPSAARGYRRTGLAVGYLSLFLVVFEIAIIALGVLFWFASV